jgi:hypothetical protein
MKKMAPLPFQSANVQKLPVYGSYGRKIDSAEKSPFQGGRTLHLLDGLIYSPNIHYLDV